MSRHENSSPILENPYQGALTYNQLCDFQIPINGPTQDCKKITFDALAAQNFKVIDASLSEDPLWIISGTLDARTSISFNPQDNYAEISRCSETDPEIRTSCIKVYDLSILNMLIRFFTA